VGQLEGRVAVVTGAGRGIGRAAAVALANKGAKVALVARSSLQLAEAAGDVRAVGGCALEIQADVGAPDVAALVCRRVASELGPVDILVNNAAVVWPLESTLRLDPEDWIAALQINLVGVLRLTRAVLPDMVERGWGRIVNVSSTSVREPIPYLMLSNVHRTGTLAAFKTLARQLAGDGITLNTLLAGMIATDRLIELAGGSREAVQASAREQVPAGRLGRVEEFAAAAAFLCSDAASYITGAALAVDGGLLRSM